MEGLSVGRLVHFVIPMTCEHRPALVSRVIDSEVGMASLWVFPDHFRDTASEPFAIRAKHDPSANPSTWHWPERGDLASITPEAPTGGQPLKPPPVGDCFPPGEAPDA